LLLLLICMFEAKKKMLNDIKLCCICNKHGTVCVYACYTSHRVYHQPGHDQCHSVGRSPGLSLGTVFTQVLLLLLFLLMPSPAKLWRPAQYPYIIVHILCTIVHRPIILCIMCTSVSESTSGATSTNPYSIGSGPGDPSDLGCSRKEAILYSLHV